MTNVFKWFSSLAISMLLFAGVPGCNEKPQTVQQPPWLSVCLVRTDLGIGDGAYVREVDEVCRKLADAGTITYVPAGDLPSPLIQEGLASDIGLPETGGSMPGTMTLQEAQQVMDTAAPSQLLILSSAYLLPHALTSVKSGKLKAEAVLLLDEEGFVPPENTPVPVYRFRYDISEVAFLCGVAVAASSNNGMFALFATSADPQAQTFLDAARAGAYYWTNGAQVRTALIQAAPDGSITPSLFIAERESLFSKPPLTFRQTCNHFVVNLGRATPTIMYAFTQSPYNGYVAGGYADFRQVRPARVVGCAIKHPGVMLQHLFDMPSPGAAANTPLLKQGLKGLTEAMPKGVLAQGLADGAVGVADYDLYARSNPDAEDIQTAVEGTLGRILDGDTIVADEIKRYIK